MGYFIAVAPVFEHWLEEFSLSFLTMKNLGTLSSLINNQLSTNLVSSIPRDVNLA